MSESEQLAALLAKFEPRPEIAEGTAVVVQESESGGRVTRIIVPCVEPSHAGRDCTAVAAVYALHGNGHWYLVPDGDPALPLS